LNYQLDAGETKKAALDLAGRGLKVFPLTPRSKEPLGGSNGHLDATSDPETIERMWRDSTYANIGVASAASGLYMVDVDTDPVKGKVGGETWAKICGEHGFVDTFTVRSWSGGLHFWYRMPEGMQLRNTSGRAAGRGIGPDVDTRGNGYVIAPPSVVTESANGIPRTGQYTVEKDVPIMWLPQHLVEMCKDVERPERVSSGPIAAGEEVLARLEDLAGQLEAAPDGQGNATASRIAFWCGQYVGAGQLDEDEVIGRLLDAISSWQWRSSSDFTSMSSTIIRGVKDGVSNPRAWERPVNPGAPAKTTLPAQAAATSAYATNVAVAEPMVTAEDLEAPEGSQPAGAPPVPEDKAAQALSDWATDVGQAQHLAEKMGTRVLHADGVGWHRWDGCRWAPVSEDAIDNMIARFYSKQFKAMVDKFKKSEDDKYLVLAKAYRSFQARSKMNAIRNTLAIIDGVFADPAQLDAHPELMNTPNFVVNLRTGKYSKHDPDLYFTKVTNGRYRPGFRHDDWDKALLALPPEQADYMQIRMGQAATGHNAKDAIFLVGGGNNGKSAYTTEGVFPALGDYAHMAQPTLISKGQGTGATPDRASLRGVRFALIEELPESHALSVEEIKRITDTGYITARLLHQNPITFPATHTMFVTSNSKPAVAEVDWGTWRRLLLVNFPYTFMEKPQAENDRLGDPTLKRRVRDNTDDQHDAIITWLVEGAMRYFADPMLVEIERRPLEVAEAVKGWQMEADRIMAYFADRLEVDPDGMIARPDLFTDFTNFLVAQNHSKWSSETFLGRFRVHELIRQAGVTEGQVRTSSSDISRPPLAPNVTFSSSQPPLPGRVRVFRGLRFRPDEVD
jgi:P4 family phage/plasmid primase-like protien